MAAKRTYLSKKRKLSDFERIIFLPNAKNRAKIYQGTVEILWCIVFVHGGARLTTLPSGDVSRRTRQFLLLLPSEPNTQDSRASDDKDRCVNVSDNVRS